jgi:hypothetical protein
MRAVRWLLSILLVGLAACSTPSAVYVREGNLYRATAASSGERPDQLLALHRALDDRRRVRVHVHVLHPTELQAVLGGIPQSFASGEALLMRCLVEVVSAVEPVRVAPRSLTTALREYDVQRSLDEEMLLALFRPRPSEPARPESSNLEWSIKGLLAEGAIRLLTVNQQKGSVAAIDRAINTRRTRAWASEKERLEAEWRESVLGNPESKATFEKLRSLLAPREGGGWVKKGEKQASYLLLRLAPPTASESPRGLALDLGDQITRGELLTFYEQPLLVRLEGGEDPRMGLDRLFSGGPRWLAELPSP